MTRKEKNERAQFLTACQQITIKRLEVLRKRLQGRVDAWEEERGKPNEEHPELDDLQIGGRPSRREEREIYLQTATLEVELAEKENNAARRELENFLRDTPVED